MNKLVIVLSVLLAAYSLIFANNNEQEWMRYADGQKGCRLLDDGKIFCHMKNFDARGGGLIFDTTNNIWTKMYPEMDNQPHSFYQKKCEKINVAVVNGRLLADCSNSGRYTNLVELLCMGNDNWLTLYDEDEVQTYKNNVFRRDNNKCRELFQMVKNGEMTLFRKSTLDSLMK